MTQTPRKTIKYPSAFCFKVRTAAVAVHAALTIFIFPAVAWAADKPLATIVPERMEVDFKRPAHPFMILDEKQVAEAREKVRTVGWAREALEKLKEAADEIVASPMVFPEGEGGWTHFYVCPKTGTKLKFDYKSPHDHYCESCQTPHQGKALDDAWRAIAMGTAARQQDKLSAAWLLTGDNKYAEALKHFYLDLAEKYPKYRLHDRRMTVFGDKAEPIAGYATSQSIEECDLLSRLAFSYDVLAGSGVLTEAETAQIEEGIWKRGRDYMYRIMELHPSGGNWWIWHATGAIVVGVLTGDDKLVDIGLNTPKTGILSMLRHGDSGKGNNGYVNADGFTGELSPGYHHYPFQGFNRVAMATKSVGIDFYKLPVYRKMFDLPIKIALPNFHLPRMNDGEEVILGSDWAGIYELASHWYNNPTYERFLASIYGDKDLGVKRDGLNALLFGPAELDTTPLDMGKSTFLQASGLGILRSPLNDWNVLLKADRGSSGHRHPDALNLLLFANGEDAMPGTGTTGYGHYSYLEWGVQTVAHNTITLNTKSQRLTPDGQKIEFSVSGFGSSAIQSVANNIQGKEIENETPARLRRTIVMTPHAVVDFFRVETDQKALAAMNEKPPVNQLDWAMHFYGELTVDSKSEPHTEELISTERLEAPRKDHHVPHQGYKYITERRRLDTKGEALRAQLSQPAGGKVDIWLSPSGPDTLVLQALGLGLETDVEKKLPVLMQRRQANDTIFAAVYAPYKDKPVVTSAQFARLSDDGREAILKLQHAHGEDLFLSLPEAGELVGEGAKLQGALGCRSSLEGGAAQWILVGTRWEDGYVAIYLPKTGEIVVEKLSSGFRIHNGGDAPTSGEVTVKATGSKIPFSVEAQETKALAVP